MKEVINIGIKYTLKGEIEDIVKSILTDTSMYRIKVTWGGGDWTKSPWISITNTQITTTIIVSNDFFKSKFLNICDAVNAGETYSIREYEYNKLNYDNLGRVLKCEKSNNGVILTSSKTYNWEGKILTETDTNGNITTYTYDERGLLIEDSSFSVVRTDNGPQFISHIFKETCESLEIHHERIPVRTPNKNAHIESFQRILEDECFSVNEFESYKDA